MPKSKAGKKDIAGMTAELEAAYQDFLADLSELQAKRRELIERFQKRLERHKVEKIRKNLE